MVIMTTIYLINTTASKVLNAFCEKNAKNYSFEAVDKASQTMQNVMFADYKLGEELKSMVAKRIKFQQFRPQTNYRCMFLNLRTGKVVTLHNMEDLTALDVEFKTAYANNSFDKTAVSVRVETQQWLTLAEQLTDGIICFTSWMTDRQNCLDKMNLYLSDKDFDTYNAGHLEPRMKSNVHVFREDYKFFDLQFKKGDTTQHNEERETEQYVVTDLETLKNFCHVLTCRRYGINFEDSVGNGGRVTREASQGIINYSEIADVVNQLPADERQEVIDGLASGEYTVEDIYNTYCVPHDFDVEPISYREF